MVNVHHYILIRESESILFLKLFKQLAIKQPMLTSILLTTSFVDPVEKVSAQVISQKLIPLQLIPTTLLSASRLVSLLHLEFIGMLTVYQWDQLHVDGWLNWIDGKKPANAEGSI